MLTLTLTLQPSCSLGVHLGPSTEQDAAPQPAHSHPQHGYAPVPLWSTSLQELFPGAALARSVWGAMAEHAGHAGVQIAGCRVARAMRAGEAVRTGSWHAVERAVGGLAHHAILQAPQWGGLRVRVKVTVLASCAGA